MFYNTELGLNRALSEPFFSPYPRNSSLPPLPVSLLECVWGGVWRGCCVPILPLYPYSLCYSGVCSTFADFQVMYFAEPLKFCIRPIFFSSKKDIVCYTRCFRYKFTIFKSQSPTFIKFTHLLLTVITLALKYQTPGQTRLVKLIGGFHYLPLSARNYSNTYLSFIKEVPT